MEREVYIFDTENYRLIACISIDGTVDEKVVLAKGLNCLITPKGTDCIITTDEGVFVDADKIFLEE